MSFLSGPLMCIIMQSAPTGFGKSADSVFWGEGGLNGRERVMGLWGFKIFTQNSRTFRYHGRGAARREGGGGGRSGGLQENSSIM